MKCIAPAIFVLMCVVFFLAVPSASDSSAEEVDSPILQLADGFHYTIKTLGSLGIKNPSDSTLNPQNGLLFIPRYNYQLEIRPDFYLDTEYVKLIAKPRFVGNYQKWEDGVAEGEDETDDNTYINEWLVRVRLMDGMFASYGRENLQWGPSFFISPSNIFFKDNGQSNPKQEVAGMDFARYVWVLNSNWSMSLIWNTDRGEQTLVNEFEDAYAFKMDFTTFRKYASLLTSFREGDRAHVGGYAGWTFSDALLLYAEGDFSRGTSALYPEWNANSPFQYGFVDEKDNSDSIQTLALIGGSYTLEAGPTLSLEYIHNSAGYDDEDADQYYALRRNAANDFSRTSATSELSRLLLIQALDPKLRLLRRHYVMAQYQESQIFNKMNLIFRYTYNMDDSSGQFIPIVEYDVSDHAQLFCVGSVLMGPSESEFRSVLDNSVLVGVEYTF